MSIVQRAEERFDKIRIKAMDDFDLTRVSDVPPSGWCVSAIARIKSNAPAMIDDILGLQRRLEGVSDLYRYPADSLHLSLLGCTQREDLQQTEFPDRLRAIKAAVAEVVGSHGPVRMDLGRLNLIGNQFFVEVVTPQTDWSEMRAELAAKLEEVGEHPIVYADTEPIHLNIARISSSPDIQLIKQLVSSKELTIEKWISIVEVELVITDFVVSPESLVVLENFRLDRP